MPDPAAGLLRISVTAGPRRADLAVPGAVPLVELLPDLARSIGMLDVASVTGCYQTLTAAGTALRPDAGLAVQGVGHGDILVLSAMVDEPPALLDDPVEAMATLLDETTPWDRRTAWRARVGVAAVLLLVGAVLLVSRHGGLRGVSEGAVLAGAALAATALFSRSRHEPGAAVAAGHVACAYAGAAGLSAGSHSLTAAGGVAMALTGLLAGVALAQRRVWMLPSVTLGVVAVGCGVATEVTAVEPAVVLSCVLALAVLGDAAIPDVAVATTGVGRHVLSPPEGTHGDGGAGIDLGCFRRDVRRARELVVVLRVTLGALLVLLAPAAVSLGPVGAAVPLLGSAVVLLRARRCQTGAEVALGVATGVATLLSTALSLAWLEPGARPVVGTGLAIAGVGVLIGTLRPAVAGVRTSRWAELAERAALAALVPALLLGVALSLGEG